MPRKKTKKDYIFAVGRRKEAICRIRLYKGKGENLVNGQPQEKYFPADSQKKLFMRPFQLTKTEGKYYVTAKVRGGGKNGQFGALIHGVSRALAKLDEEKNKPVLRKYGLLTRDPRERERRKVGTGGKARRKKQSPKR